MTLVRCPGCSATAENPASEFRCASCARLLRWRAAGSPILPLQLGLFGEATPVGGVPSRRDRPAHVHGFDVGGRSQSWARSHQDVLAAAAELFYVDHGGTAAAVERARGLLTGQSAADLREAALGAAWMLATTLRSIEANSPGLGREMLHLLGLTLAKAEDSP